MNKSKKYFIINKFDITNGARVTFTKAIPEKDFLGGSWKLAQFVMIEEEVHQLGDVVESSKSDFASLA